MRRNIVRTNDPCHRFWRRFRFGFSLPRHFFIGYRCYYCFIYFIFYRVWNLRKSAITVGLRVSRSARCLPKNRYFSRLLFQYCIICLLYTIKYVFLYNIIMYTYFIYRYWIFIRKGVQPVQVSFEIRRLLKREPFFNLAFSLENNSRVVICCCRYVPFIIYR